MSFRKNIVSFVLILVLAVSLSLSAYAMPLAYITPPSSTTTLNPSNAASAVTDAVRAAGNSNSANVSFNNVSNVSKDAIESAFKSAGNKDLTLKFNQVEGNAVTYQISLTKANVANLPKNVSLKVSLEPKNLTNAFTKHFSNPISTISAPVLGSEYKIAFKPTLSNLSNLKVYTYDSKTNTYTEIPGNKIFVDKNGYVHVTSGGGNLVLSDGPLTLK